MRYSVVRLPGTKTLLHTRGVGSATLVREGGSEVAVWGPVKRFVDAATRLGDVDLSDPEPRTTEVVAPAPKEANLVQLPVIKERALLLGDDWLWTGEQAFRMPEGMRGLIATAGVIARLKADADGVFVTPIGAYSVAPRGSPPPAAIPLEAAPPLPAAEPAQAEPPHSPPRETGEPPPPPNTPEQWMAAISSIALSPEEAERIRVEVGALTDPGAASISEYADELMHRAGVGIIMAAAAGVFVGWPMKPTGSGWEPFLTAIALKAPPQTAPSEAPLP